MSKGSVRACDSCRREGGKDRQLEGFLIIACDECWKSSFRQERMLGRAKERDEVKR